MLVRTPIAKSEYTPIHSIDSSLYLLHSSFYDFSLVPVLIALIYV